MNSKVVNIQPIKSEADKHQAVSWIVKDGEIIITQVSGTDLETVTLNIEQAQFVMPGFDELFAQGPEAS